MSAGSSPVSESSLKHGRRIFLFRVSTDKANNKLAKENENPQDKKYRKNVTKIAFENASRWFPRTKSRHFPSEFHWNSNEIAYDTRTTLIKILPRLCMSDRSLMRVFNEWLSLNGTRWYLPVSRAHNKPIIISLPNNISRAPSFLSRLGNDWIIVCAHAVRIFWRSGIENKKRAEKNNNSWFQKITASDYAWFD